MISLDANNPNQVSSPTVITVDLTDPGKQMIICSGIAISEWTVHDDGTVYNETVTLNLRQVVLDVDQATVTVGLASIGNGKTNNLFACNSAGVDRDPTTGELIVTVDVALMGDPSALDRFGYQVVATVSTQKTGITGTIRWAHDIFNPQSLSAGQLAQLFQVSAGTLTQQHLPNQLSSPIYASLANGITGGLSSDSADFLLPYQIPGAPYDEAIVVQVTKGGQVPAQSMLRQIAGPNPLTLTISQPSVSGVDFRLVKVVPPR